MLGKTKQAPFSDFPDSNKCVLELSENLIFEITFGLKPFETDGVLRSQNAPLRAAPRLGVTRAFRADASAALG